VIPSAAAAFTSSPSTNVVKGEAGLMTCNYANTKSFAQQVFQYLESLNNMEAGREGNMSYSFNSSCNSYFC
jgi:hypothetical protein